METNLTSQEATKLANNFFTVSVSLTDYLFQKWGTLTQVERDKLISNIRKISNNGQKLLALSATLVVEQSKASLTTIDTVTNNIKANLQTIANVQKTINIATSVVKLGSALISKNPVTIVQAVTDLQAVFSA
ncbi:MAG: hypothetical protein MUF58_20390 [Arcicella sp.]|jgi:hypothetical protein|nr:hypothetical protein [Arcicella sp.]